MEERIGHYRIVSELGRGGMGVVYKAHEESLNRFVAIKLLGEHLAGDPTYVQRFLREAQSAARLNHPNIVQIHMVGEDQGRRFFAMEYVHGTSLQEMLRGRGHLPVDEAARLVLQAAAGLAAAHDHGVIHRDIKPANLLIDERGLVKIADFGLALQYAAVSRLTATGMFMGTPGYLAPEQCMEKDVDHRADIYSLGVTFYETLAGRTPFTASSPLALLRQIIEFEPPDVRSLNPDVDDGTRAILGRMMAKDRDHRYSSCHELIAEIQGHLELLMASATPGKPMTTTPPAPMSMTPTVIDQSLRPPDPIAAELLGDADGRQAAPPTPAFTPAPPPVDIRSQPTGSPRSRLFLPIILAAVALIFIGVSIGVIVVVLRYAGSEAVDRPLATMENEPPPSTVAVSQPIVRENAGVTGLDPALQSATAEAPAPTAAPPTRAAEPTPSPTRTKLPTPLPAAAQQQTEHAAAVAFGTGLEEVQGQEASGVRPTVPIPLPATATPVPPAAVQPTPTLPPPTATAAPTLDAVDIHLADLDSGDSAIEQTAAKILYRTYRNDPRVQEGASRALRAGATVRVDDGQHVDAMAWLTNILGASGNPKYAAVLQQVVNDTKSRKIKRYAKKNLKLLR